MKKFFILLLAQIITISLCAQIDTIQNAGNINPERNENAVLTNTSESLLKDAANAYSSGDYSKACDVYQKILEEKGESAAIYYNIGNCYYKQNKTAPAILNYERALLLDPGNGDIRFNLEIAKLKTVDKIDPIKPFFLSEWINDLQNLLGTNQWAYSGIICFFLLIGMFVLFFFSRKIILKKLGFYAGIVLLVIIIASNVFSHNQKKRLTNRNSAIVFAPTVTIKSSPDNSGTDLFPLHEGTKVEIKSKLGEWYEIIIADGNVGWIQANNIEII
jgi:tetratricopeptide (TPR) repeat protein